MTRLAVFPLPKHPEQGDARAIERVERPSVAEFKARFFRPARPVHISGALSEWRALSRWTPEYLTERVGDATLHVFRNSGRTYGYFPTATPGPRSRLYERMKLADYIHDTYRSDAPPAYYAQQINLKRCLPGLLEDVAVPMYAAGARNSMLNLWLGAAGQVTHLHYDSSPNFMAMVGGAKRFVLFAPDDSRNLYPWPALKHHWSVAHHSQVDLERPDMSRFPSLARAKRFEVTIRKGDLLFIPPFWWHQVYTLEAGPAINVFTYRLTPRQMVSPMLWRIVTSRLLRGR